MNTRNLLRTLLLLNVLLLTTAVFRWNCAPGKPVLPPTAVVDGTNTNPSLLEMPAAVLPLAAVTAVPTVATNTFDWRRVESADYHQYIANLRASGCPEKTIRDIIIADVNEMFRGRARSLSGSTNRFEYWKSGDSLGDTFNEEAMAKQRELTKEKRELLKTLLGDNAPTGLDSSNLADSEQQWLEQMLDFLPADKLASLMELGQKYSAKLNKAYQDALPGDAMAVRKVVAERDTELLQLLTAEQKFEYELRVSDTAMQMQYKMGDFQPTEQQFRDMFKAQKAFDDEFTGVGANATAAEQARRAAAQKELATQFQNILGEDGYQLYRYEKRWPNDPLNQIARDNNIPKDTAFKVFDLQKAAQAEAARVRANQALAAEQRTAALAAMRAETEQAIGQVLGAQAAQAYVKRAVWIKRLNQ